jgi:CTP:molybdopterin cytidylyltransferase MocA
MLILAAGFSQRMGVLKPLLPVGGETALCRAVGLGRHEKIHTISVVTGHRHEEVEAALLHCRAKNVRHIHNAKYADGMFTSVVTGVRSLPSDIDGFFLLPVDHCAVHPDTLEKLIAAFILSEGQHIVYPVCQGERGHPPLIPYAFAAGVRDYDGKGGMQGYLSQFPSVEVDIDDPGMLLDMDTPEDYKSLLQYLGFPTHPDEYACYKLLEKYETPENIIRHSRQVGSVALRISDLLSAQGITVNKPLLYSACLLHDIARTEPEHAAAGAQRLLTEGYPDAADLVRFHMDLPEGFDPDTAGPDAYELMILYLSDKLCRDGPPVHPDKTLESLATRYATNPEALAAARRKMERAKDILRLLENRHGIRYGDI